MVYKKSFWFDNHLTKVANGVNFSHLSKLLYTLWIQHSGLLPDMMRLSTSNSVHVITQFACTNTHFPAFQLPHNNLLLWYITYVCHLPRPIQWPTFHHIGNVGQGQSNYIIYFTIYRLMHLNNFLDWVNYDWHSPSLYVEILRQNH